MNCLLKLQERKMSKNDHFSLLQLLTQHIVPIATIIKSYSISIMSQTHNLITYFLSRCCYLDSLHCASSIANKKNYKVYREANFVLWKNHLRYFFFTPYKYCWWWWWWCQKVVIKIDPVLFHPIWLIDSSL